MIKHTPLAFIYFLSLLLINCRPKNKETETATSILSNYYKSKYVDKSVILNERDRLVLDTVVMRLTETNEPRAVIQYVVNDFKLKHGAK
jgi:hypothetical protein